MKTNATNTRDHHVPRMYLRRFAQHRPGGAQLIAMSPDLKTRFPASINDVAVERGFYWGSDIDGVPHHDMEKFFTALEDEAATAFRRVLDTGKLPSEDALPPWPPRTATRHSISWWIAAQILRTLRQRTRLELAHHGQASDPKPKKRLDLPRQFDSANRHIKYIAEMIERLAAAIFYRPWGVGFSDYCLLTGDVPVIVLNGQDHSDQHLAVQFWDIYMPLDSHRCLYLPGLGSAGDREIRTDHRFKLHPGLAIGLNSMVIDTAVRHVFFHPEHDPSAKAEPAVQTGGELPQFLMTYEVIADGYGVERRWLDTHPQPPTSAQPPTSEADIKTIFADLAGELDKRQQMVKPAAESSDD